MRLPGFIGFRQARILHRIEKLLGEPGDVYTIFITFKRKRTWGFIGGEYDEVKVRTDENMTGWLLPTGQKQTWEEQDLLKDWD
jgi:hypothetical protein